MPSVVAVSAPVPTRIKPNFAYSKECESVYSLPYYLHANLADRSVHPSYGQRGVQSSTVIRDRPNSWSAEGQGHAVHMSFYPFGHERDTPVQRLHSMDVEDAECRPLLDYYSVQYAPPMGEEHVAMEPTMFDRISRLTPVSEEGRSDDYTDDEDVDTTAAEVEDDVDGERVSQTAAERMAEKRKMKRFRLTRNQTRFLLSEFAHHAHPDAARRERLSKEIPGWTARQVQVWFQNRRAKLKRLVIDDQERMIRSRAGPTNFDMDYPLQSPFEHNHSSIEAHVASPPFLASRPLNDGTIYPVMVQDPRYDSDEDHNVFSLGIGATVSNFSSPTSPVNMVDIGGGKISYNTETMSPPQRFQSANVHIPNSYPGHHYSEPETHEEAVGFQEGYSNPLPMPGRIVQYPPNFQQTTHPQPLLPFERNGNTHFDQYLDDPVDINRIPFGHAYDDNACDQAPRLDRPCHNPREHRYQRSTAEPEHLYLRQFTAEVAYRTR